MKFTVKLKITRKLSVWRETGEVRKANNGELFRCGGGVASGPSYTEQRIVDSTEEEVVVEREVPIPEWVLAPVEGYMGAARAGWSEDGHAVDLCRNIAYAYYAKHPERVPQEE